MQFIKNTFKKTQNISTNAVKKSKLTLKQKANNAKKRIGTFKTNKLTYFKGILTKGKKRVSNLTGKNPTKKNQPVQRLNLSSNKLQYKPLKNNRNRNVNYVANAVKLR